MVAMAAGAMTGEAARAAVRWVVVLARVAVAEVVMALGLAVPKAAAAAARVKEAEEMVAAEEVVV